MLEYLHPMAKHAVFHLRLRSKPGHKSQLRDHETRNALAGNVAGMYFHIEKDRHDWSQATDVEERSIPT